MFSETSIEEEKSIKKDEQQSKQVEEKPSSLSDEEAYLSKNKKTKYYVSTVHLSNILLFFCDIKP